MGTDKESLFCTECYEKDFAPKCVVCNEPFKGGHNYFFLILDY